LPWRRLTAKRHVRRGSSYDLLGPAENFDLHRLPSHAALEFRESWRWPRTSWLAGTASSLACTVVVGSASANRFELQITLGAMSSLQLNAATVLSPVRIRWSKSWPAS